MAGEGLTAALAQGVWADLRMSPVTALSASRASALELKLSWSHLEGVFTRIAAERGGGRGAQ
jgi:hypothetical protein